MFLMSLVPNSFASPNPCRLRRCALGHCFYNWQYSYFQAGICLQLSCHRPFLKRVITESEDESSSSESGGKLEIPVSFDKAQPHTNGPVNSTHYMIGLRSRVGIKRNQQTSKLQRTKI